MGQEPNSAVCSAPRAAGGAASLQKQRGFTLLGLIFWVIVIGFLGYVAIRVVPTVSEYMSIQSAVDKVAAVAPATVPEVRVAFDRQKDVDYTIRSISGKDLDVSKENGRVVIGFAYEKEIPLGGPVYLLLKYKGRSK